MGDLQRCLFLLRNVEPELTPPYLMAFFESGKSKSLPPTCRQVTGQPNFRLPVLDDSCIELFDRKIDHFG